MSRKINFSNPFNGRKWLLLLKEHEQFGMTFIPELLYSDKKNLGFSFKSNSLGFRGPHNVSAPAVVAGTSFAMGLSVSNGENWYELVLDESKWLNIGMPIGIRNHYNAINQLYKGSGELFVYLYHPNIWSISLNFEKAREKNVGIFNFLKWRTDYISCIKLYFKWLLKMRVKKRLGINLFYDYNGEKFLINANYSFLNIEKNKNFIEEQINLLNKIFSLFKNVIVIRVPIKEELVPEKFANERLKKLWENYEFLWNKFVEEFEGKVVIEKIDKNKFDFSDYLPLDTHWSKQGNIKFANEFRRVLVREGFEHLLIK